MQQSDDRRSDTRIQADFDLHLALGAEMMDARVQDISTSGVRCITDRQLPVMTHIQLVLLMPDESGDEPRSVACGGAIVRSEAVSEEPGGFDTAVFFTDLLDADRSAIDDYVAMTRPD